MEALQKDGGGGDNLAVGVGPGESTSAPTEVIPGSVLSPVLSSPSGPAGPEINVLGNGTTIIDGDTTPSDSTTPTSGAPISPAER